MSDKTQEESKDDSSTGKKLLFGSGIAALAVGVVYGVIRKVDKDHLAFDGKVAYRKTNRSIDKAHVAKENSETSASNDQLLTEVSVKHANKRKRKAVSRVEKATKHLDKKAGKAEEKATLFADKSNADNNWSVKKRDRFRKKSDLMHEKATRLFEFADMLKSDIDELDVDTLSLARKRDATDEAMKPYQLGFVGTLESLGKNVENAMFPTSSPTEWKAMVTSSDTQVAGAARGFLYNWNDTAIWDGVEWHTTLASALFNGTHDTLVLNLAYGSPVTKKTVKSWFQKSVLKTRKDLKVDDGIVYYQPETPGGRVPIGFLVEEDWAKPERAEQYAAAKIAFAQSVQENSTAFAAQLRIAKSALEVSK